MSLIMGIHRTEKCFSNTVIVDTYLSKIWGWGPQRRGNGLKRKNQGMLRVGPRAKLMGEKSPTRESIYNGNFGFG